MIHFRARGGFLLAFPIMVDVSLASLICSRGGSGGAF
jgi:hypothetical protein